MKKSIIVLALACAAALGAVVGCGEGRGMSDEERFNAAKEKFDNYTVDVQINYSEGGSYNTTLMVDGLSGMLESHTADTTIYYKKDGVTVYYMYSDDTDWREATYAGSIEEASGSYNGYVYMVENLFYDDFESVDGELVVTDEALEAYSEQYGMEVSSCRVKLSGSTIASATVVVNYYGERMEVNYSFSDYGTTEVTLSE